MSYEQKPGCLIYAQKNLLPSVQWILKSTPPPIYKSIINTEFHAMGIQDVQGPLFFHGSYGGRFLWGI